MSESKFAGKSRSTASSSNPVSLSECAPAPKESALSLALDKQRDEMEHLLVSLQELEMRLLPVTSQLDSACVKSEESTPLGSSLLVVEIERTTRRLAEYTDKVHTLISRLEI